MYKVISRHSADYIYIYIVKNVSFQVLLAGYNLLLKNWRHSKWPTGLPRVNSSSAFLSYHIQNLVDKPGIPSMPHQTDVFAVGTCSQEACCLIQVSLSQTGGLVGFGRWRCGPPLTRVTFQGATHACNVNVGWLWWHKNTKLPDLTNISIGYVDHSRYHGHPGVLHVVRSLKLIWRSGFRR